MDPTLLLKAHERLQRCMADDRDGENPDDPSTVQSMLRRYKAGMVRGSAKSLAVPAIPPGIMCMTCRG